MKIDLINNNFNKYVDINISDKFGIILDKLLNNCSLLIYNIENCEIVTLNESYFLGSEDAPFHISFEIFLKNINKNEEYIQKIIIHDRKRDENGNVTKENKTIENYNKWFQFQENENFVNYVNSIPNENSHIIRYPISSLLDTILRIPSSTSDILTLNNIDFFTNNEINISHNNDIINYDSNEVIHNNEDSFIEEEKLNDNMLDSILDIEEINEENLINDVMREVINDVNNNLPIIETPSTQLSDLINIIDNYIRNTEHLYINDVLPTLDNFNSMILNDDVKIILDEDEFQKLERITSNDDHKSLECLICLDCFEKEETLIKISCNHIFHCNCIKNWVCEESNKCPVCRIEIAKGKCI